MAASDIFDLAAEWLAVCSDACQPQGAIPDDSIFVSSDPPAMDCAPQLTVHTTGNVEAPTSPQGVIQDGQRARMPTLHFVGLVATIIRCAPVPDNRGNPPGRVEKEAAAAQTSSDLWAIINFTRQAVRANALFVNPHSDRREVFFDPQVVLPSQGGMVGWAVPIRVQLDGYRPTSL